MTSAIRMASETIGERYQNGAESDNDPEPDQPNGHLVPIPSTDCSRAVTSRFSQQLSIHVSSTTEA